MESMMMRSVGNGRMVKYLRFSFGSGRAIHSTRWKARRWPGRRASRRVARAAQGAIDSTYRACQLGGEGPAGLVDALATADCACLDRLDLYRGADAFSQLHRTHSQSTSPLQL